MTLRLKHYDAADDNLPAAKQPRLGAVYEEMPGRFIAFPPQLRPRVFDTHDDAGAWLTKVVELDRAPGRLA